LLPANRDVAGPAADADLLGHLLALIGVTARRWRIFRLDFRTGFADRRRATRGRRLLDNRRVARRAAEAARVHQLRCAACGVLSGLRAGGWRGYRTDAGDPR
jgi:hypothetical protein